MNSRRTGGFGDRNRMAGLRAMGLAGSVPVIGAQWAPLREAPLPPELAAQGFVDAWVNERCAAFRALRPTPLFAVPDPEGGPGPDGQPAAKPGMLMHLMIIPRGADLSWEEMQQVKDQLAATEGDGVELFPATARRLDQPSRHLWVLPPGVTWPVGMVPASAVAGQGTVAEADLLFWQVAAEAYVEIWDSAEEAAAAYAARRLPVPDGAAVRLDALPAAGVRSDRAAAREAAVRDRIAAIAEVGDPPDLPADLGAAVAAGAAARAEERAADAEADLSDADARDAAWLAAERQRLVGASVDAPPVPADPGTDVEVPS